MQAKRTKTMSNTTASAVSHYLDIYLLPDPEFATPNLMNALYAKLHRALHDRIQAQQESIGISFPDQRNTTAPLGTTLRLHSSEAALTALMSSTWLTGMRDHTRCTPIQAIPSGIQTHRSVRRIDVQSNPEKLRRRWLKHHPDQPEAAARAAYPDTLAQRSQHAFIQLSSRSNGHQYKLFIEQTPANAHAGNFSSFGLSTNNSTIPWF